MPTRIARNTDDPTAMAAMIPGERSLESCLRSGSNGGVPVVEFVALAGKIGRISGSLFSTKRH